LACQTTLKSLCGKNFGAIRVQTYIMVVTQAITTLTQKEKPLGDRLEFITLAEFQLVIRTAT